MRIAPIMLAVVLAGSAVPANPVLPGEGWRGSAGMAGDRDRLVIVPLQMDRKAGTVTIWLQDLYTLLHHSHELSRLRIACGDA